MAITAITNTMPLASCGLCLGAQRLSVARQRAPAWSISKLLRIVAQRCTPFLAVLADKFVGKQNSKLWQRHQGFYTVWL